MSTSLFVFFKYLAAGEESRLGHKDYWNDVFLLNKPSIQRRCLEFTKAVLTVALSIIVAMVMASLS